MKEVLSNLTENLTEEKFAILLSMIAVVSSVAAKFFISSIKEKTKSKKNISMTIKKDGTEITLFTNDVNDVKKIIEELDSTNDEKE